MEEQTIAIVSFTGALKREVVRVQKELAKLEKISDFRIQIEASGRVSQGDVKIVYKLSESYGSNEVEGNDLTAITEEFLRRKGWKERHAPLLLTVGEQKKADPDMPFDKDD